MRNRSQSHHRRKRPIDRDYAYSRARHRERIAARYLRKHLDQKWLRRLVAHSTRASVKTSTLIAPALSSTRAHSSTVAPVVITSSTSSTRRLLIRSGLLTANARRTFLILSS